MASTKICSTCKQEKPLTEFHKHKALPDGHINQCKPCRMTAIKKWRKENPDKHRATQKRYYSTDKGKALWKRSREKHRDKKIAYCRAWREAHPGRNAEYGFKRKLKVFGLTLAEYKALDKSQGGVCAICGGTEPNGDRLHIDHCHDTGKVRGLICEKHNLMLGMSGDSSKILRLAAEYLEKHGK